MNALFQKIKDTFTQAQGKRVNALNTYVSVVSVEHVRHNAGSARLVNRRWSDDMAHDELIVTFRSKNGNSRLVLTAFDHDTDDVRYEHLQNNVVCFFGKIVDEDDIDVKGWSMEHVVITQ